MMDERGFRILAALDAVAAEHEATPAQIALAWLRGHGIAAPIASATSLTQLAELTHSVQIDLDADQLARLDTASEGFSDKPTGPSGPPRRD
jgi:aryl-alcohol dehydrogenase-like predicted oxidoreductase